MPMPPLDKRTLHTIDAQIGDYRCDACGREAKHIEIMPGGQLPDRFHVAHPNYHWDATPPGSPCNGWFQLRADQRQPPRPEPSSVPQITLGDEIEVVYPTGTSVYRHRGRVDGIEISPSGIKLGLTEPPKIAFHAVNDMRISAEEAMTFDALGRQRTPEHTAALDRIERLEEQAREHREHITRLNGLRRADKAAAKTTARTVTKLQTKLADAEARLAQSTALTTADVEKHYQTVKPRRRKTSWRSLIESYLSVDPRHAALAGFMFAHADDFKDTPVTSRIRRFESAHPGLRVDVDVTFTLRDRDAPNGTGNTGLNVRPGQIIGVAMESMPTMPPARYRVLRIVNEVLIMRGMYDDRERDPS